MDNSIKNLINQAKKNKYKKQDEKVLEEIEKISFQGINKHLLSYIKKLNTDESILHVFNFLDKNECFHKFRNYKIKENNGNIIIDNIENPTIFLYALKDDESKHELLKQLKEMTDKNITKNDFYNLLVLFSDENKMKHFIDHIKNESYRNAILNMFYEEEKIDETIQENEESHKPVHNNEINYIEKMNDEKFIKENKDDIRRFVSQKENYGFSEKLGELTSKQLFTIIDILGIKMSSKDITNLILTYENKIEEDEQQVLNNEAQYMQFKIRKERENSLIAICVRQYSQNIEPSNMSDIYIALSNKNPKNIKWPVEFCGQKISESALKTAYIRYNQMIVEGNSEYVEFANNNPHYLYDVTKIYYNKRNQDKKIQSDEVYNIIKQLPEDDRIKFEEEYKNIKRNNFLAELNYESEISSHSNTTGVTQQNTYNKDER